MNGRQRFQAAMHYQPVDRVPNIELGCWTHARDRWLKEGMPADTGLEESNITFNGNAFFGLDAQVGVEINSRMIPGFTRQVVRTDERISIVREESGALVKVLNDDSSMPQYLKFPVQTREDFHQIKRHYDENEVSRFPSDWEQFVSDSASIECPVWFPGLGMLGLYSILRKWMGTENACTIFYDDPLLASEMIEFAVDLGLSLFRRAASVVRFDYFMWWEDYAYNSGPLVSPKLFRQFLLPGYRRINDMLHSYGVDIICIDTDGDPRVLIPFLLEAGINCLMPCEQCNESMHPLALRREFGRDLLLWGGIDKRALSRGRRDIEQELTSKLPELLREGGFLPHLDHLAPPDNSYDNWLYYLSLKRRLLANG